MLHRALASLLLVLALGLALPGCAGKSVEDSDPEALFKDAEQDIEGNRYILAIDKLRLIKNKFPYSKFSAEAQLRIADVYFLQESFGEAALAYETFRDLHPKHPSVPYAMYRTALSYFKDTPELVARDQASARKALDAYTEFLKRYPEAPESNQARADLHEAMNHLAEKELYIGEFYFKREKWESAQARFNKLIEQFPETEAAKRAREKLPKLEQLIKNQKNGSDSGN